MNQKSQGIWVGVNRNGDIAMFTDEPTRNTNTNKWVGKHPYINSVLFKEFEELIKKSNITWESDCNYFEIQIGIPENEE